MKGLARNCASAKAKARSDYCRQLSGPVCEILFASLVTSWLFKAPRLKTDNLFRVYLNPEYFKRSIDTSDTHEPAHTVADQIALMAVLAAL